MLFIYSTKAICTSVRENIDCFKYNYKLHNVTPNQKFIHILKTFTYENKKWDYLICISSPWLEICCVESGFEYVKYFSTIEEFWIWLSQL